jgi:hypothetical protein
VFLSSFIPTTLSDLGTDAHAELKRLQTGQREPAFAAAIMNMIHSGSTHEPPAADTLPCEEDGSGDTSDDDEDDDDSFDSADGKYRRCLPSRDDIKARSAEKQARKDAKKLAKESAALKRQNKIPKHVKKRAMKTSKR